MKNVYVVMRNADFTEGRGPMLMDSIWSDGFEAIRYAESIEPYHAKMTRGKHGYFAYGQFIQIEMKTVLDSLESKAEVDKQKLKEAVLRKLSQSEREALGLD